MVMLESLQNRLRLRDALPDSEWQIWEHKTLNIHRGVLYWSPSDASLTFAEMENRVRKKVAESYRVSWWRGFAFGVVVHSKAVPPDISAIESTIDTRVSGKGTWQWTVLACSARQTAVGVHTWVEGYLSPVYRQCLDQSESQGWIVGDFKKEKDKLMQFLTSAARIKGYRLKEFETRDGRGGTPQSG
jgi:hypothetical protein